MWYSFEHFVEKINELDSFIDEKYNNVWQENTKDSLNKIKDKNLSTHDKENIRSLRNLDFMFKKTIQLIDKK